MKILKAEEGKVYQSLVDSSVYATTIYLADNDSESNYKLINESEVIMTTDELEEDQEVAISQIDNIEGNSEPTVTSKSTDISNLLS